ncbi:MAG TPA: hypothetical protein VF748_16105 [Candidatus Acidoferrum sp.]
MPNANIISRFVGAGSPAQGLNVVPSITLVTTTEQLFTVQSGGGTAIVFPQPVGQLTGAAAAPSFGSGFDGFAFKARAVFKCTTGGTSTVVINMYCNQVSTTITAGNKVATITSQSLATASASGYLEYYGIWDGVSKVLNGTQLGAFGTSVVSSVVGSNTNISIPALSNLNFSLSATNGSSVTGTVVAVTEFVVETV